MTKQKTYTKNEKRWKYLQTPKIQRFLGFLEKNAKNLKHLALLSMLSALRHG